MTDQHPAVAHLLAAHERAVDLAQALPMGPWQWAERNDGNRWESLDGVDGPSVLSSSDTEEYHSWIGKHPAFNAYLPLIDPAWVLLRVAEERNILTEHTPTPRDSSGEYCMVCSQAEEQPQPVGWWVPYPCRTVVGLAKTWGWKEAGDG